MNIRKLVVHAGDRRFHKRLKCFNCRLLEPSVNAKPIWMGEMVKRYDGLESFFSASSNASGVGIDGIKIKCRSVCGSFGYTRLNTRPLDAESKGIESKTTSESEVIPISVPKIHGDSRAGDATGGLAVCPVITGLADTIVAPFELVARGCDADEKRFRHDI